MTMSTRILRRSRALAFTFLNLLFISNVGVEAGNTTCAGNLTDWCVLLFVFL